MNAMRASTRRGQQVLLLCVLALAVLGMHHIPFLTAHAAMADDSPAAAMSEAPSSVSGMLEAPSAGDPAPGAGHDLMHLCLAVLLAATGLVLLASWLVATFRTRTHVRRIGARSSTHPGNRSPPRAGRSLLTSVCILRI